MNLCYLPEHRENLLREGLNPRRCWVIGNPILEVVNAVKTQFKQDHPFYLVTCHRAENTENKENLQIDHIYPVSKGGTDDLKNLVIACRACNQFKKDRLLNELGINFILIWRD